MPVAALSLLALPPMLGCNGDPTFACVSLCNADPCDPEPRARPTLICGCAVSACSPRMLVCNNNPTLASVNLYDASTHVAHNLTLTPIDACGCAVVACPSHACNGDPTFACVSLCNADPCDSDPRARSIRACGCAVSACSPPYLLALAIQPSPVSNSTMPTHLIPNLALTPTDACG
jgi:hypothetical protein